MIQTRSIAMIGLAVVTLFVSCAGPPRSSPLVLVLAVGPEPRVGEVTRAEEDANRRAEDRQAMRYLACAPDGRSYTFAFSGRFDVQFVLPFSTRDSPYSICIGAPGASPVCRPVADGGWTVEVRAGDEVSVRASPTGLALDARLCPVEAPSPVAEWSTKDESRISTDLRSLPEVGIVVQELAPGQRSRGRASAIDLWISHELRDAEGDEHWELQFLACAPDGHRYMFTVPGRFDLLAIEHTRRLDSPYSVCVGPPRVAPRCHALIDGRSWQVDVRNGDELMVQSSEPENPLDARLCPTNDRFPFAEWSQTAEALRPTDQRPLPYLGIIARRVGD